MIPNPDVRLSRLYPIITYTSKNQYIETLKTSFPFYLLLSLPTRSSFHTIVVIVNDCMAHKNFKGIIFDIHINEIILDRLFFLKKLSTNLINKDKNVGIWGIPYCAVQNIFEDNFYALYAPYMIPEESKNYSKYMPFHLSRSSFLLGCIDCIDVNRCCGLGDREENYITKGGRVSQVYYNKRQAELYIADTEQMQKVFNAFVSHIIESNIRYAHRYVYFVKNIDHGSEYSFKNRFVYHCDFLPKHELAEEVDFLNNHVVNKDILASISTLHKKDQISKIAYSKVIDKKILRESFYVSPHDEYDNMLLNHFGLQVDLPFAYKFYGLGVDYYNNEIKSYKVYCIVKTHILAQYFPSFIKEIGIDIFKLMEKEHYYSIRYDKDKQIISERIDLIYSDSDYMHFEPYIKHLGFTLEVLQNVSLFIFAFEFKDTVLTKVNAYYKHRQIGR